MLSLTPVACAADDAVSQARRLFDRYVALGAAYDVAVADLYADSAFIKNTRRYPDGQSRSMVSVSGSAPAGERRLVFGAVLDQRDECHKTTTFDT